MITCALLARTISLSARAQNDYSLKHLLRVAIVGSPNVGKSTLLNRLVDHNISCVSNKVHTTYQNILGVITKNNTQLEFFDSPGIVTKEHLLKHHSLSHSTLLDPVRASKACDLIAVVVDVSNIRETMRLNQGIVKMLEQNSDKESILVLNKVDLVKDKRQLLDIGTRLTQGCIEGRLTIRKRDLQQMSHEELARLNLLSHVAVKEEPKKEPEARKRHKYVIDLEPENALKPEPEPKPTGFRNFSRLFSISALKEDGIDELMDHLMARAKTVERWPHGPDYLTNLSSKELVYNIIRGNIMDAFTGAMPYTLKLKHKRFEHDEFGSLYASFAIICPKEYMLPIVLGSNGSTISEIITKSRETISNVLGCEVQLNIEVVKNKR